MYSSLLKMKLRMEAVEAQLLYTEARDVAGEDEVDMAAGKEDTVVTVEEDGAGEDSEAGTLLRNY